MTIELTPDIVEKMTARQMATAGIVFDRIWEFPNGRRYQVVLCATKQLRDVQRDYADKLVPAEAKDGRFIATYLEVQGVCVAHARTQDPDINIDALRKIVDIRERADKQGLPMFTVEVVPSERSLEE